jgi:hypothetical protein
LFLENDILAHARDLHQTHLCLLNEFITGAVYLLIRFQLRVHCPRKQQLFMTINLGLDVPSRNLTYELCLNLVQSDLKGRCDIPHVEALIGCDVSLQVLASNLVVGLIVAEYVVALKVSLNLSQTGLQQLEASIKEIIKDVFCLRIQF